MVYSVPSCSSSCSPHDSLSADGDSVPVDPCVFAKMTNNLSNIINKDKESTVINLGTKLSNTNSNDCISDQ